MGFINIFVSKDAYINVKNRQLTLEIKDKKVDYPLEDVNSVMIERLDTTISTYALSTLSQYGIVTFICDDTHIPCGVVLPFCEHCTTLLQYKKQVAISKPLQKQLWQAIIKRKILNQNEVLNLVGKDDVLLKLSDSVLSGDSGNNEAKASVVYFKELFGKDFARRTDNSFNAFLNYGYSIIRGFVARSVVSHGLLPFLGLFHHNQFNQFNLADDLIEVFRPFVDLFVKLNFTPQDKLTSQNKAQLYNLVNYDCLINGDHQPISYAIELMVQSLVKSFETGDCKLKMPQICGLSLHQYE